MRPHVFLALATLLISFFIDSVNAKCCRADQGGGCGDNSNGTPCCGYKKCNGFCCACQGVNTIRQEVEVHDSGTKFHTTISIITVPPGTTLTCRADHITKEPFTVTKKATAAAAMVTAAPKPGYSNNNPPPQAPSECDDIFRRVSKGAGKITMDDYLEYFGFKGVGDGSDDCARKGSVVDMFNFRDKDGNGVLTLEEIEEMIDDDVIVGYGT
jgi:hypothetical protein